MEGLIPMVFRTIQRSRTRRHYQYLSSSSATTTTAAEAEAEENAIAQSYNIADFYPNGEYVIKSGQDAYIDRGFNPEIGKVQHHRHRSFQAQRSGASFDYDLSPQYHSASHQKSKKLVRFRSHRLFSCVSGEP